MPAAGIIYSSSPFWPMHILSARVYTYTVLVNICQQGERVLPVILANNDDARQTERYSRDLLAPQRARCAELLS